MATNVLKGIVNDKKLVTLGLTVVAIFSLVNTSFLFIYHYDYDVKSYFLHQFDVTQIERKNAFIKECNCTRENYYYGKGNTKRKGLMSSCSDPGTFFQTSQKVVSYSFHLPEIIPRQCGTDLKSLYLEGILENLRTMRLYYPKYTMRLYTDVKIDYRLCPILCNNSDLFWCNIEATPMHGNQTMLPYGVWRFLPLGDPTVDHFLSRDLDSILSKREAAAVADWLQRPKKMAIHLMRDNKSIHSASIHAGMWGASNSLLRRSANVNVSVENLLAPILVTTRAQGAESIGKSFDQTLLQTLLFHPPFNREVVAYDSYHCKIWRNLSLVRPFPIQRKNNSTDFVGNGCLGRLKYDLDKCPLECRPKYGKDWEWC